MAYTVRSILGKTRLHRPDLREAELDYLTQEIVRRICRLTMLSQTELNYTTDGPITQIPIVDPDGNDINRIHLVRYQDSVIPTPTVPTVALNTGTGYAQDKLIFYTVVAVGGQGWVSNYSPVAFTQTTSSQKQIIVTMPPIPNAPQGFDHFDLYKYVLPIASQKTITGISIATQAVVTSAAHGLIAGDFICVQSVAGMTQINGKILEILSVTTNTITVDLDTTNASNYSVYTSGGFLASVGDLTTWYKANTKFTNSLTAGVDTDNTFAGTVTIGNITYNYVNFQTDTASLPLEPTGDYRTLGEGNLVEVNNALAKPDAVFGTPNLWAYDAETGYIKLYPPPSQDLHQARFQVTYSVIPVGEIDEIPLLPESEEAVYYGTLAEAYMIPGPGANLELAKNYEVKFNFEMSNLKAIAIQGQSGRLKVISRPLGGRRRTAYGAFGSSWSSGWGW